MLKTAPVTRVERRDFEALARSGAQINLDRLPAPVLRQLESAGVSVDSLRDIAGDDNVIKGEELHQLYNALALRSDGNGGRVDNRVSADLFRALSARAQQDSTDASPPLDYTTSGSGRGRSTGVGAGLLQEAGDLRGRTDGQRPNWFVRALESIAEFFVELFTSDDYITSAERDFDVGRRMATEHPETLRAVLAAPGGEDALRGRLLAQRPAGTSEADWNGTVNDVMRGIRRTLDGGSAADLPDAVNPQAGLLVRDRAAVLYAQNTDPAARTELANTVDALGRSGLSERAQIEALNRWNAAGRPAQFRQRLEALETGLETMSPAVRREAIAQLEAHPDRLERLSSLAASPGFQSTHLSDADRLALLRTSRGTPADVTALATQLSSPNGRALPAALRSEIITGFEAHSNPAQMVRNLDTLFQNRGFSRVSPQLQASQVRLAINPATTNAQFTQAMSRLNNAYPARLNGLNEVMFNDRTLAQGATGPEVPTAQRYLRALGFDGTLGMNESDTFGPSTTAAITEFQRRHHLLDGNPPAATAGVLDRATLSKMQDEVRARRLDPLEYRFTTELSMNRPTRATDGPWRATQRWTPALQDEFSQFAAAYSRARIPQNPDGSARRPDMAERVDCADLSYEALIQFARQRGLPVHFSAGGTTYSNNSRGPIVGGVQSDFGAMHLQHFTRPVPRDEVPRTGDLGNMRWAQSANGHDSSYWHSHNIIGFDPLYREAAVVYGSLDDLIRQPALDTFNARGFNLTVHDIPEVEIIDAINDDSGQGRQVDRAEQESRVRGMLERHTTGGHRVSDADVSAFITMVSNDRNIYRNAPTAVSERPRAFGDLVEGSVWADPAARRAAVADLNARFGASFTEADIDRLVGAGSRSAVDAAARELVEQRVPAARRAGAQEALTGAARGTVRYTPNRDALADPGLRAAAVRDFNSTYRARVTDNDLGDVLRAGSRSDALTVATRIVEQRGVPADRRADAARALVDAADQTRAFRRWDFDMFNRHM